MQLEIGRGRPEYGRADLPYCGCFSQRKGAMKRIFFFIAANWAVLEQTFMRLFVGRPPLEARIAALRSPTV
jgi:hypothetical protein